MAARPACVQLRCSAQRPQAAKPAQAERATARPVRLAQDDDLKTRLTSGFLGAAVALSLAVAEPASAAVPFLKSTGARGPLAEEEATLFKLREQKEAEALAELQRETEVLEEEVRRSKAEGDLNQLCATPFGVDVVGITEFVALTGALVGGISARRRKQELERLNEQLRTINSQLRQQARAGTLFAPGLTYVPPGLGGRKAIEPSPAAQDAAEDARIAAAAAAVAAPPAPSAADPGLSIYSDDEEQPPESVQCQKALKDGKRFLKDDEAGPAMVRFEKALMLARSVGDRVKERRAVRGLAAACRQTGQLRQAITHLERVLEISREIGDYVGDADAYGTIADLYTDLGEFERAAEFYDRYISRMDDSGPV